MDNPIKYCSFPGHGKNEAIIICQDCRQLRCNKCEKIFNEICKEHNTCKLKENKKDIFIGLCFEKNHLEELKYFCKNHNALCCGLCITKIKDEENGQHSNCEICPIKNIENEKRKNLKENIKRLENISNNLKEKLDKLKIFFEKANENKENLKIKIQKIFTKIRNDLNNREDELLNEVDKKFEETFGKGDIIRNGEKLPNKIKISLEKGKIIENDWENNNLSASINDCITIENDIRDLNLIEKELGADNLENNFNIKFIPEKDDELNLFCEKIKQFGKIFLFQFSLLKCPENINEERKYIISGDKQNIITKIGTDTNWMGVICEHPLNQKVEEHKWKIKILKTHSYDIMIGIANGDFDINRASYNRGNNFGWYYYSFYGELYSGPPQNYQGKKTNLKNKKNEIVIVMNMKKRTLKFIIDGEDQGDSFTDIPLDKPLFPSILLYNKNDSVEIIEIKN